MWTFFKLPSANLLLTIIWAFYKQHSFTVKMLSEALFFSNIKNVTMSHEKKNYIIAPLNTYARRLATVNLRNMARFLLTSKKKKKKNFETLRTKKAHLINFRSQHSILALSFFLRWIHRRGIWKYGADRNGWTSLSW